VLLGPHIVKKQVKERVEQVLEIVLIVHTESSSVVMSMPELSNYQSNVVEDAFDGNNWLQLGDTVLLLRDLVAPWKLGPTFAARLRNRGAVPSDEHDAIRVVVARDVRRALWTLIDGFRTALTAAGSPKLWRPKIGVRDLMPI
jgi:hypothetical protein